MAVTTQKNGASAQGLQQVLGFKSYQTAWTRLHKIRKAMVFSGEENELLPRVHMVVSLLQRWLLGTHQGAVTGKHLPAYLDEYVFRFNRCKSVKRGLLFYRLLENAMNTSLNPIF
jgi:hypothetical protein